MVDLTSLRLQIGQRRAEVATQFDLWTSLMYHRTFVCDGPEPVEGLVLPPGRHFLYARPDAAIGDLRPDGTPGDSDVIPDLPLPRREPWR